MKLQYELHRMLEEDAELYKVGKWLSTNMAESSPSDKLECFHLLVKHLINKPTKPVDKEYND